MKPTPRSHHPRKLLTNYVTSICVNDYLKYILGYKYQHTKVWRSDYKQEILCFLRILFKYTGVSNLKLFTIWVRKPIYVVFIIGLCKYLLIPSTQFWPWDFFWVCCTISSWKRISKIHLGKEMNCHCQGLNCYHVASAN